jgi:hypothetical protein
MTFGYLAALHIAEASGDDAGRNDPRRNRTGGKS